MVLLKHFVPTLNLSALLLALHLFSSFASFSFITLGTTSGEKRTGSSSEDETVLDPSPCHFVPLNQRDGSFGYFLTDKSLYRPPPLQSFPNRGLTISSGILSSGCSFTSLRPVERLRWEEDTACLTLARSRVHRIARWSDVFKG